MHLPFTSTTPKPEAGRTPKASLGHKKKKKALRRAVLLPTLGLTKYKQYFLENLSLLVSSGRGIISSLDAIARGMRARRMRIMIKRLGEDVQGGFPLWKALEVTEMFKAHVIALIRIGEESGTLSKNLQAIAEQEQKDAYFRSQLLSAMMYPAFVILVTVGVGLGIAWFILPRLTTVFEGLKVELPIITEWLLTLGSFLKAYGTIVVPSVIFGLIILFAILFMVPQTNVLGKWLLFHVPGIRRLIQQVQVARFGSMFGTLLHAGLPVLDSLDALVQATDFPLYKPLYVKLRENIHNGESFESSFRSHKGVNRLIPTTIQELVIAGEQSGALPETLLSIGETFQKKSDTTTKSLAVILEPILLVIVWGGVMVVALAVILPLYGLIGGLDRNNVGQNQNTVEEVAEVEELSREDLEDVLQKQVLLQEVSIVDEGIEFLNVRSVPVNGEVVGKALPGEVFEYLQEVDGWYEIEFDGASGWVSGQYVEISNE